MSTRARGTSGSAFAHACGLLEAALSGGMRQAVVAEAAHAVSLGQALSGIRAAMRAHAWRADGRRLSLDRDVRECDRLTRREGLHVLHDWDGKADRVNEDAIPIEVVSYAIDQRGGTPADPAVIAILVDYYFLYLLTLLSVRAWDDGDATENLHRLDGLLAALQGPGGSGERFAAHAETLLLIAGAHFEIDETGYDVLLGRVRSLGPTVRTRIALTHAASLGSHLRFGFEATYAKDPAAMRADNVADYPWLCFSLAALMDAYERSGDDADSIPRDAVVEALLNGVSADADAFIAARPPDCLAACEGERAGLRDRLQAHGAALVDAWQPLRPSDARYSPLSLFFNFSHNVLKGTVIDAVLSAEPWAVALDDLLTSLPHGSATSESKLTLARTLMGYARARPDLIRGRLMPVIVYDPSAGRQAFGAALRALIGRT